MNTMLNSHFHLDSVSYKNSIFSGFTRLQQSNEFVDMTLATDGYLVKVHQTIMALASPYLKELLQSAPCQHPVLLLSNISHEMLSFILEYIYSGEVKIPSDKIVPFLEAAKIMHISGIETINLFEKENITLAPKYSTSITTDTQNTRTQELQASITINKDDVQTYHVQVQSFKNGENAGQNNNSQNNADTVTTDEQVRRINMHEIDEMNTSDNGNMIETTSTNKNDTSSNMDNSLIIPIQMHQDYSKSMGVKNSEINAETDFSSNINNINPSLPQEPLNISISDIIDLDDAMMITPLVTPNSNTVIEAQLNKKSQPSIQTVTVTNAKDAKALYSISNRGSVQIIIDSFLYYCHNRSMSNKRRWRCLNYRDLHCKATLDSEGDHIITRSNQHNHPNHEKKILHKLSKQMLFTSLEVAEEKAKQTSSLRLASEYMQISE